MNNFNPMKKFVFTMLVLCALISALGDEVPARRIALLNTGPGDGLPAGLLPLLEARLLEKADRVTLLERAQMDRLLREQALGLAEGQLDGAAAMRAGELWGVDAFVLLEARGERQDRALRLRIVETRYGLKLDDALLPVPPPAQYDATVAQLAERILSRLSGVRSDPAEMRVVGILAFRNVDPSPQWDGIGDEIRAGIEQLLVLRPGTIVAERQRTRPLSDERELVADLPPALRAATLTVDGEYRLSEENPDMLVVNVQGRRDGTRLFLERVEGPRDQLHVINRAIAELVSERLGKVAATRPMDARLEAEMLLAQANATPDFSSAIAAIEAAIALAPDKDDYRQAYLERVVGHAFRSLPVNVTRAPDGGGPHPLRMRLLRRYLAMVTPLADQWLREPADTPFAMLDHMLQQLQSMIRFLEPGDRMLPEVRDVIEKQIRPLVEGVWHALRASDDRPPPEHARLLTQMLLIYRLIGAASIQEAHDFLNDVFLHALPDMMIWLNERTVWPADLDSAQRFDLDLRLFETMREHDRPVVRLVGKRGLVRLYAVADPPRYDLARRHYEEFERDFLEDFLAERNEHGRPPYTGNWILPFLNVRGHRNLLPSYRFYADDVEDVRYRAERAARVFEEVAKHPHQLLHAAWLFSADDVKVIEQAGRFEESERLLSLYIERMKQVMADHPRDRAIRMVRDHLHRLEQARERLRDKHPELRRAPVEASAISEWQAERLFALNESIESLGTGEALRQGFTGRYLVIEHGMAAVVGDRGVLFLDPRTLAPARFAEAPRGVSLGGRYAADDAGIYTVSADGILFFPRAGESRLYFPKHADFSENIHDLDALGGRVYVLTGKGGFEPADTLLEFDLEQERRRIVLSAKAKLDEQPLGEVQGIHHIAANPGRRHLRIYARGPRMTFYQAYDPETRAFAPLPDIARPVNIAERESRRRGHELMTWGIEEVWFYDLQRQERLAAVVSRLARFDGYQSFARIGEGMIGNLLHMEQLNVFSPGSGEPRNVRGEVFPLPHKGSISVRDMCMHERGLILLTPDALYAVSGIADLIQAHFSPPMGSREWMAQPWSAAKIQAFDGVYSVATQEQRRSLMSALTNLDPAALPRAERREALRALLQIAQRHSSVGHRVADFLEPDDWRDEQTARELIEFIASASDKRRGFPYIWWDLAQTLAVAPASVPSPEQIASVEGESRMILAALAVAAGRREHAEDLRQGFLEAIRQDRMTMHFLIQLLLAPGLRAARADLAGCVLAAIEAVEDDPSLRSLDPELLKFPGLRGHLERAGLDESVKSVWRSRLALQGGGGTDDCETLLHETLRLPLPRLAQETETALALIRRAQNLERLDPERAPALEPLREALVLRLMDGLADGDSFKPYDLYHLGRAWLLDWQAFGFHTETRDVWIAAAQKVFSHPDYNSYNDPIFEIARGLVADARRRGDLAALIEKTDGGLPTMVDGKRNLGPPLLAMQVRRIAAAEDPLAPVRPFVIELMRDRQRAWSLARIVWRWEPEAFFALPSRDLGLGGAALNLRGPSDLLDRLEAKFAAERSFGNLFLLRIGRDRDVDWRALDTVADDERVNLLERAVLSRAPAVRRAEWSPMLLAPFHDPHVEFAWRRLRRMVGIGADLVEISPVTRAALEAGKDDAMARLIRAEGSFRHGNWKESTALWDEASAAFNAPLRARMREWRDAVETISAAIEGRLTPPVPLFWRNDLTFDPRYGLVTLMAESGHAEAAWQLHEANEAEGIGPPDWDVAHYRAHLAWLAARTGRWEQAREIARGAALRAEGRALADYTLMLARLMAEHPPELDEYLKLLDRRTGPDRAEYARALSDFAERAKHPDLHSLSAFLAGRAAFVAGDAETARTYLRMAAAAGGAHAEYARWSLVALETETPRTLAITSWAVRDEAPAIVSPTSNGLGIGWREAAGHGTVEHAVWLDAHGIPVMEQRMLPMSSGDTWEIYLWKQNKAWLHGEWSILVRHLDGGAEAHHRYLARFGASK